MTNEKISNEAEKPALNKGAVSGSGFISEPKTVEEFEHNARFQFDNVSGWIGVNDYESALIKARYLVDALEAAVRARIIFKTINTYK